MRIPLLSFGLLLAAGGVTRAQSVGIGTPSPDASAALEVRNTGKGLLIPRVALGSLTDASTIASPAVSLLVYNTNAALSGGVGYYFNAGSSAAPQWQRLVTQAGLDATNSTVANLSSSLTATNATVSDLGSTSWRTNGNAPSALVQLGTTTNQSIDLVSNNVVRGRMSSLGEFFWGATSTALPGDLFNAVSSPAFPWALNGYSSNNGGGVFGNIRSGTTTFAAVQGEYNGTGSFNSAGVRGIYAGTASGTGFRNASNAGPVAGVNGSIAQNTVGYSFGVAGTSPGATVRTGGLIGDEGGFATGAVGYLASNLTDYSFYGFGGAPQTGTAGGRSAGGTANAHIGLGLHGGVMGGWVRGQVYGLHALGERYSLYVDGPAVTNQPLTQLVERADGSRMATYAPSATTADVSARGRAELRDGAAFVPFPAGFAGLLSNPLEATITVTPTGDTRGVFVERVTETGFYVRENQQGHSQAALNWTATGVRRGFEQPQLASELLDKEFDSRMRRVMHNEANPETTGQPLWWDGQRVRYDQPPAHRAPDVFTGARPQEPAPVKQP